MEFAKLLDFGVDLTTVSILAGIFFRAGKLIGAVESVKESVRDLRERVVTLETGREQS